MSVTLEAIKFNHDSTSATNDALNVRRNGSEFVTVPEWRRGFSVRPEDAPAGYAISETRGRTITIQAQLRTDEGLSSVEVRALDAVVDPPEPQGCLGRLLALIARVLRALVGNVLGDVAPRSVTFGANGLTNFETFQLQNVRLWSVGVGIHLTRWRWQYRLNASAPWTDIATTDHRIYVLLELPKTPWQQAPYAATNVQLPWTDVLDYACIWGMGATDVDTAATRVTRRVFELAPNVITYDCPGGGSTHYALGSFNCTAFLDRLKGAPGNGLYVNCTDCATITSTFANILGCDLWQSRMGWSFDLNPVLGIGATVWQTACGWGGFSYHEVAWKGACTANESIFDACLEVDGDADPTIAPHTALLPTNLQFGNRGAGGYRDRLCPPTPSGQVRCNPQPGTRQRRAIV